MIQNETQDVVIIGGGFYGVVIAVYLAKVRGMKRILLVERESGLLKRASYNNQARVHNGYHYPRSYTTAYRSRINMPRFMRDWPNAVMRDFTKLYAIARRNSKTTSKQFERFCREIGAPIAPAESSLCSLFEERLIESVFVVDECAFDSTKLAIWATQELANSNVKLIFDTLATDVLRKPNGTLQVKLKSSAGTPDLVTSNYVFNCTYARLNQLNGDFHGTKTKLKQEITEIALLKVSPALMGLGITVMDGPFFSIMPFPARNLHTISHVRYTPHLTWADDYGVDPYQRLEKYDQVTRVDRILRDAGRYIPEVLNSQYVESLFEVKTVLVNNESDDGRPILFEKHSELPGCYSVLGGKIDNIYDVIQRLDAEVFI